MSDGGLSTSQVRAAGAYARTESLAVSIPVRPSDPTRPRFQVGGQSAAAQNAQGQAPDLSPDENPSQTPSGSSGGQGTGLLGAFTSFLARIFGQPEGEAALAPAARSAGIDAYARFAVSVNDNQGEVIAPGFPRLSSGRALDLTV